MLAGIAMKRMARVHMKMMTKGATIGGKENFQTIFRNV